MTKLSVDNIVKQYPTRGEPLVVLRGVSLDVESGQSLVIVGPSGSGKSTLLHVLGTLDRPSAGSVVLDGTDPFSLDERRLARFRNRRIGFIFQDHHLLPQLSALENVLVPTLADGRPDAELTARARELLASVGLADRSDHRPAELSGGERQRVAVARALIRRPTLLLADEPTGNLDRSTADGVGELLVGLQQEQQAILVVVTHSVSLAENMQRRLELDEGKLR